MPQQSELTLSAYLNMISYLIKVAWDIAFHFLCSMAYLLCSSTSISLIDSTSLCDISVTYSVFRLLAINRPVINAIHALIRPFWRQWLHFCTNDHSSEEAELLNLFIQPNSFLSCQYSRFKFKVCISLSVFNCGKCINFLVSLTCLFLLDQLPRYC